MIVKTEADRTATCCSFQRAIFDTVSIRSTNERAQQNGVGSGPTPFPAGNGVGPAPAPFSKAKYVLYFHILIWFKRSTNGVGDVGAGPLRPHFLNNETRLRHAAPRFANMTWGRRCRECSDAALPAAAAHRPQMARPPFFRRRVHTGVHLSCWFGARWQSCRHRGYPL